MASPFPNLTNGFDGGARGTVAIPVTGPNRIPAFRTQSGLTIGDKITLTYFAYITLAVVLFATDHADGWKIVALNLLISATIVMLSRTSQADAWLAATRDLFPAVLLLAAYRESGLLLTADPAHRLDLVFIPWDRALLHTHFVQAVLQAGTPWLQHYLEFAYLLCYPLVPFGAVAIGLTSWVKGEATAPGARPIDDFWATVLLATLFCYAVFPFFPLTPPRVLFGDLPGPQVEPLLRKLNFWLLDHYSVQACIFPSGHVAAATAVALQVRKHTPRFGAPFMFLGASVALATVYGRYHYAADAVAGALVGVAAYALSTHQNRGSGIVS